MATSGTYIFNPDLAEIVDEAFERCRIDPAKIVARHIISARRSMRFMLADWATDDYHDFRVVQESFVTVQGQAEYTAGVEFDITDIRLIDVINVVLTRSGTDTPVEIMSRSEYLNIPEKDIVGRPDRIFIDKQRDRLVFTLWTTPENSTDIIKYDAVRKFEDSDTASDTPDIPYQMTEAFAAGLASKLAAKFAPPELEQALYGKAQIAFKKGTDAVRERGDVRIVPESGFRRRRGSAGRYR